MSDLILWKNQEIHKIKKDMDELLTCFLQDFSHPLYHDILRDQPRITTFEREDRIIVKAELPHLLPDSLDVSLINNEILIRGEQKNGHSNGYRRVIQERTFSTRIPLPCSVRDEDITAVYRDEVLVITLSKNNPRPSKKINVDMGV